MDRLHSLVDEVRAEKLRKVCAHLNREYNLLSNQKVNLLDEVFYGDYSLAFVNAVLKEMDDTAEVKVPHKRSGKKNNRDNKEKND